MKRNFFLMAFTALILGICCMSCEKEDIESKSLQKIDYSLYSKYGEVHNLYLSNVKDNFVICDTISQIEGCLNYIALFNINYSDNIDLLSQAEVKEVKGLFNEYQKYYYSEQLFRDVYEINILDSYFKILFDNNVITMKDMEIVKELLKICHSQYLRTISIEEYYYAVKELVNQWIILNEKKSVSEFSAIILNIATYSSQWWLNNSENTKLAPWVASDAVGAAYGAAFSAAVSYAQTGHVNWTSVGCSAVSGAVTGSTGVIGKVGKWISKVIK